MENPSHLFALHAESSEHRPAVPDADLYAPPQLDGALSSHGDVPEEWDGTSPRLVIRGENHSQEANGAAAFVDWLNVTFKFSPTSTMSITELDSRLREAFGFGLGRNRKRGHLNYEMSWELGREFGIFATGGGSVGGTSFLSISGTGCTAVKDWKAVYELLQTLQARITRVDLTHDDLLGIHDIKGAVAGYLAGDFNSHHGRPPKAEYIDDFDSQRGKTLYVGSRESGKLLRVYEKGKQLGSPDSPWVRWELELHNKDRVIPHEVLVAPGAYLATAYPCLAWISDTQCRIRTLSTTACINLDSLLKHCRGSYGKLIWTLWKVLEYPPELIVSKLAMEGVPPRLNLPVVGGGDV